MCKADRAVPATRHALRGSPRRTPAFTRGRPWLLGLLLVSLAGALGVGPAHAADAVEPVGFGNINWTTGWIKARGMGLPPADAGRQAGRALAERAAYVVALRNLLEIVNGVRVDAESTAESYLTRNESIRTMVSGYVRGAEIVNSRTQPDGSVEVTVKMPLWGSKSLIGALMAEKPIRGGPAGTDGESRDGYTGLVIDARGLGLRPACFPMILDETGAVVYGPDMVDREAVETSGMVEYHALPAKADLSGLFGSGLYVIRPVQASRPPRGGRRPLKIKGANKAGALQANVLISTQDAQKLRDNARLAGALRRARVVVVTDPLIGGIQGRVPADGLVASVVPGPR